MINVGKIRAQFPLLHQKVNGKDLVYFDNAASSQKPQVVLDALTYYYSKDKNLISKLSKKKWLVSMFSGDSFLV